MEVLCIVILKYMSSVFFKTDGIFVVKSTMFLGMGVKHEARGSLRRNIYTYIHD